MHNSVASRDVSRPDPAVSLGTIGASPNTGFYVYVQADGAIAEGDVCNIQGGWQAVPITTTNGVESVSVGVAQVAIPDNSYGWLLVHGAGNVKVGANCAASVQLYTTANDGELDDAATAVHIGGIQLNVARGAGAGVAPAMVTWPRVDLIA